MIQISIASQVQNDVRNCIRAFHSLNSEYVFSSTLEKIWVFYVRTTTQTQTQLTQMTSGSSVHTFQGRPSKVAF